MNFFKDDIVILKKHVKISKDFQIQNLAGVFSIVENNMIRPVLGPDLFSSLLSKANETTPEYDPGEEKLVDHIRSVVGQFALAMKFRSLGIVIDDQGTYKKKDPNKWFIDDQEIERYIKSLKEEGYGHLETMLAYLEETSSQDVLPGYFNHSNQVIYRSLFLKSSQQFSEFYETFGAYTVFRILKPILKAIQEDRIKKLLGNTLYTTLAETAVADYSPIQQELLYRIRRTMVYYSVARALKERKVKLNHNAVTVIDQGERFDGKITVTAAELMETYQSIFSTAEAYESELISFLNENLEDFPGYLPSGPVKDINEKHWGIFVANN